MLLALCLGLLILSACAPHKLPLPFSEWQYTNVKVLDDDATTQPDDFSSPDILALYLRESKEEIQLRLDFFDLAQSPDFDLHLAFDSAAGGAEMASMPENNLAWDILVSIAASGQITIQNAVGQPVSQARIQVFRDPILDTLTLSASRDILPAGSPTYQVLAWLTAPESEQVLDTLPLAYSASRPPQPVSLLMAFSDSFLAYTPAQALRRWDGAHTGPSGGRHGLYNLLRISANFQIPVILLDLLTPSSLSALDYMDVLEQVSNLAASGQVITAQYVPTIPSATVAGPDVSLQADLYRANRELVSNFNIRQPPILYSPSGYIPQDSQAKIVFIPGTSAQEDEREIALIQPQRWQDRLVLLLPDTDSMLQASIAGPTRQLKQTLVNAMLEAQVAVPGKSSTLLLLGGSLPASTWGEPQAARATLRYLASRPWLKFLSENEILTLKVSNNPDAPSINFSSNDVDSPHGVLWQTIESGPQNQLTQAARQAFLAATNPVYPHTQELQALRHIYLQQTWILLAAAEWGENPSLTATCELDLERDGMPECVYANHYLYAVFGEHSGSLTHLFYRIPEQGSTQSSLHQIIGPSSQIISGLSEANRWDLSAGYSADPSVIQGAFFQEETSWSAQIQPGEIRFATPDQSVKAYRFSENTVEYHYGPSNKTSFSQQSLPVLLDPWRRFESGWSQAYQVEYHQDSWLIRLAPGLQVKIRSTLPQVGSHFRESQDWMALTENPNREQPAGHFLPFPLALFDLASVGDYQLTLEINGLTP